MLGGVVLVGLGFALGYFVPIRGAGGFHPMMAAGGFRGGFPLMMAGARGLFGVIQCLGPLAGIVALIVVLTRRPTAPTLSAPAPMPEAAPTEDSSKTSPKSK